MLTLLLVGLNHKTAEVAMRERAAFAPSILSEALHDLTGYPPIREAAVLSTCNRVEIVGAVDNAETASGAIECFLADHTGSRHSDIAAHLYRHTDRDAVRHVFRVASSLDSMILGEPQILGQVKNAYAVAVEAQTAGTTLNALYQAAFRVAKRVRAETGIGEHAISVSSAAVELAVKIFGDLAGRHILIVGAGKMGELAARHLTSSGAGSIRVTNRSPEAARQFAGVFSGEAVPFEELPLWVGRSDIVITSTGAPQVLVDKALARRAVAHRNAPIVFIDISVPRNVDPEVSSIDNVFCYDIDDLGAVVEANLLERRKEAALAERLVEQEVGRFWTRLRSLELGPMVVELQDRIQEICRVELERFSRRAGVKDERERRELQLMMNRIASKIAHPVVSQLRGARLNPEEQEAYVDALRRILKTENSAGS